MCCLSRLLVPDVDCSILCTACCLRWALGAAGPLLSYSELEILLQLLFSIQYLLHQAAM